MRDWYRSIFTGRGSFGDVSESNNWPVWDSAQTDAYGTLDEAALDNCHTPAQLVCVNDGDCGTDLQCHLNSEDPPRGVCFPSNVHTKTTCFQHHHCQGETLCSGQGLCETPEVSVRNKLPRSATAEVQLFGKACQLSTFGISQFQGVSDFATANGMCGARNRCTPSLTSRMRIPAADAAHCMY